jgi:transcriptional regulator with XRE-family HTH domain
LRALRQERGLSMRGLAAQAGVAGSYVSSVESGRISPTIATLRKLLLVLGEDLASFFAADAPPPEEHVFRREAMKHVADATRRYILVLPRRPDIRCELLDEEFRPSRQEPPFETIGSDIAGYVLEGEVWLEVEGHEAQTLRAGDAFYVPADRPVRGRCVGRQAARLLAVATPPRY